MKDPATQRVYYYNRRTRKSVWELPPGVTDEQVTGAAASGKKARLVEIRRKRNGTACADAGSGKRAHCAPAVRRRAPA